MKAKSIRTYKSIYFPDAVNDNRKKPYITIAINTNDPIYAKCKDLSSAQIKDTINIYSYKDLDKKANLSGRSINNFVKFLLQKKLT